MTVRYVAFLRGINVGRRRVKNDVLGRHFADLGFSDVAVLIASGNVVFTAHAGDESALTRMIEAALERGLGFPVSVMLRSMPEVQAMLDLDPFKGVEVTKQTRRYVTLLAEKTRSALRLPHASPDGSFRIISRTDREIFSLLTLDERGYRTVDLMAVLEKEYGTGATTRNWNTIQKLVAF
jgi:uncharacterized protein (DUF1697 family)